MSLFHHTSIKHTLTSWIYLSLALSLPYWSHFLNVTLSSFSHTVYSQWSSHTYHRLNQWLSFFPISQKWYFMWHQTRFFSMCRASQLFAPSNTFSSSTRRQLWPCGRLGCSKSLTKCLVWKMSWSTKSSNSNVMKLCQKEQ